MAYQTLCGCWFPVPTQWGGAQREYLSQVRLESHTTILSTTSRTTLKQVFVNSQKEKLNEVQYTFPLYDGVSVVGFKCTVASKVIVGVVKEKQQARKDYQEAIDRGETAGLLEQVPEASDAFTTKVGNVPAGEKIHVEITYLGELKHDAETDGSRFTIPTVIAPRYGSLSLESAQAVNQISASDSSGGIKILVDVALESGSIIRGLQSPSHPIAVTMGRTSSMEEDVFENTHASATLTLGKTELEKDFIIVVQSKEQGTPRALLETHPTITNHRALMTTLVPKFNLPNIAPEIVFIVDRSGSMQGNIATLVAALKIFLKSLPANGTKFNICSFGSHYDFLFKQSMTYDQSSLKQALAHLDTFDANYGGTEMLKPVKATCKNRYKDMPLEVMVLTDGQIWNQDEMFAFINEQKNTRFFSLGIGDGASSALVEGIARAGNGFAQFVGENEKMDKRVVRMLKGALTPHITNYRLEVQYGDDKDDDFEMVESATESMKTVVSDSAKSPSFTKKVISLFDTSTKEEPTNPPDADRFSGLPTIAVPKVLQAPHQVPALYPFNRTTVYLLLSPEASQKTPKSVVLRGTSDQGPLELEIPVQDVGRGETIHQLAAKKAVHELEQGRGWITDLKADNKPLKTKYEGRWDLIVEREAVRLGVQFQVGGKYCSFVAVEKKDKESMDADKEEDSFDVIGGGGPPRPKPFASSLALRSQGMLHSMTMSAVPGGPPCGSASPGGFALPLADALSAAPRGGTGQAPMRAMMASAPSTRARAAPESFGGSMNYASADLAQHQSGLMTLNQQSSKDHGMMARKSSAGTRLFGAAPDQAKKRAPTQQLARMAAPAPPPMMKKAKGMRKEAFRESVSDDEEMEDAADTAEAGLTELNNDAKMHKIIEMQEFNGSWDATDALWTLLGIDKNKIQSTKVKATAMAIAWLESQMKSEEDVWEMVVEKAKVWLEGMLGSGEAAGKAIKDAKSVLGS